ncbi:hypothetical protein MN0502_27580 [Arthrobacter sp. MN05-02]|nr:hypothetical protein MN0502_27580 [Arthrobacter sp. MN05-02]
MARRESAPTGTDLPEDGGPADITISASAAGSGCSRNPPPLVHRNGPTGFGPGPNPVRTLRPPGTFTPTPLQPAAESS